MAQFLQSISIPADGLRHQQSNVVAYFETINCGIGHLYLTERTVTWINDESRQGFVLNYPSIAVHAASGANEDFPQPCLFLMIDLAKTDIQYTPEITDEDDEEADIKTSSIRFVPEDSGSISHMYQVMNECQELNPEPEDEMSDGEDMEDEEFNNGVGESDDYDPHIYEAPNSAQWYTAETPDDEIQLSDQGRANLERILGNLDEKEPSSHNPSGDHTMDEG